MMLLRNLFLLGTVASSSLFLSPTQAMDLVATGARDHLHGGEEQPGVLRRMRTHRRSYDDGAGIVLPEVRIITANNNSRGGRRRIRSGRVLYSPGATYDNALLFETAEEFDSLSLSLSNSLSLSLEVSFSNILSHTK